MNLVHILTLLGNHVLVTQQYVKAMILIVDQLLEIVADGIGVTETMAIGLCKTDCWMILILTCWYVLYIIGSQTPETLVVLVVVVVTELCLEFQVVENFPSERTTQIQVLAFLLAVVVVSRGDRVVEVTQVIIIGTNCRVHIGYRHWIIDN